MKKLLFITILSLAIMSGVHSQIEKKTFLLGGHANLNFNTASSYLNLNPSSGLFLSDRFCLGISVPVIYIGEEFYMGLTPFARYYFNVKESRSFFVSGSVGVLSFTHSETNLSPGALSLALGHVWFLNESIGFEAKLAGGISPNFEYINIGVLIGFQIYFNRFQKG